MIRAVHHESPFDPQARREWSCEWDGEATPASLAPSGFERGELECRLNGEPLEPDGWERPLGPGDFLSYSAAVRGAEATAFSFLGQTVFTASGFYASAAILGSYVINALLISAAVNALAGGEEKPPDPGDIDSRYYGFGGITANSDYSGSALPVVYGEIPVAGFVANRYTQAVSQPTESFLYTLLVLAGHQVAAIGDKVADGGPFTSEAGDLPVGLQIDNQPAENLAGVEAYVRMGTPEQDTIPGFELARQQASIALTLLESTDVANVEATPGVYTAADPEITKWDTEVSYTMGTDADQASVVINFPQGLFNVSGSGSVQNQTVQIQARYVEVDGGGSPISDFVVLPPFDDIISNLRVAFDVEFPIVFVDPATYSAPTGGNNLVASSPGQYGLGPASSTNFSAQSPAATQLTVFAWVRLSYSVAAGSTDLVVDGGTEHPIFGMYDSGNTLGFDFGITEAGDTTTIGYQGGGTYTTPKLQLRFRGGDGTTLHGWAQGGSALAKQFAPITEPVPGGPTVAGEWVFVGVSYKANVDDDGSGEIIMWSESGQVGATIKPTSTQRPVWDETQQLRVGADQTSATAVDGFIDECVVYQRAFSATEFLSRGTSPASSLEPGIVAGWHFDADFTDFVGSNDLTAIAGASISSGGNGPVSGSAGGTNKQSKYRVDLQRINAEATGQFAQDTAVFSSIILVEYQPFTFPGCALLAVKVKATDQLSGSAPLIRVPVQGKLCNIWDGVDPVNPTTTKAVSRNPAWILSDMGTDTELTGTAVYPANKIDWVAFQGFADYCDELVKAGTGTRDLVEVKIAGGASTLFPNGFIEVEVSATDYPLSWPGVRTLQDPNDVGDDFNGLGWFEVYDTGTDGSAPSWLTAHEGDVFAIGQVRYISSGRYELQGSLAVTEPSTSGYNPPAGTIQVRLRERRMQFDGVFDRDDFAFKDALLRVSQSARAIPLFPGDRLSVFWDAARSPAHAVTMGNIVRGSWKQSASGVDARFNHELVQFLDRDTNYEPDQEQAYGPDVVNPAIADSVRTRRLSMEGVTRRSQVSRQITYDLNLFRLLTRFCEFSVGPDGIGYQVGDVVRVSHDVPQWGESGRLIQDSPDASTVYLDREIVVASGPTYEVTVRDNTTGDVETVAVTGMTAGTYPVGLPITLDSALGFQPTKGAVYAWGETGLSVREYQVIDVSFDLDQKSRRVRCLEYDANVYDDDFGELADGESLSNPEPGSSDLGLGIQGIEIEDDTPVGTDGRVSASLRVSWTYSARGKDTVESVLVWLGDASGGGLELVGQVAAPHTSFALPSERLDLGTEYQVRLQEVTRAGQRRSLAHAQRANGAAAGFGPILAAPGGLSATVSGELLYLKWDPATVSRARTVEVRMGGWILGTPIGHAPADQGYLVVEQWASGPTNDVGRGAPDLVVRGIDSLGRPTKAARISVDAEVVDTSGQIAYESSREDSGTNWAGTRSALAINAVPVAPPPLEEAAYLSYSGAATEATYEFSPTTLPEPEEVYAQVLVEAYQIHPDAWDKPGAWNDAEEQRWSWEGPLYLLSGETPNTALALTMAHNVGSAVTGSERAFIPGKYDLRASTLKMTLTRPDQYYDAKVSRMAVRYTRRHSQPQDYIAMEVFS